MPDFNYIVYINLALKLGSARRIPQQQSSSCYVLSACPSENCGSFLLVFFKPILS